MLKVQYNKPDKLVQRERLPDLDAKTIYTLAYAMLVDDLSVSEAADLVEDQGVMYEQVLALRRGILCQSLWIDAIAKLGRSNLIQ